MKQGEWIETFTLVENDAHFRYFRRFDGGYWQFARLVQSSGQKSPEHGVTDNAPFEVVVLGSPTNRKEVIKELKHSIPLQAAGYQSIHVDLDNGAFDAFQSPTEETLETNLRHLLKNDDFFVPLLGRFRQYTSGKLAEAIVKDRVPLSIYDIGHDLGHWAQTLRGGLELTNPYKTLYDANLAKAKKDTDWHRIEHVDSPITDVDLAFAYLQDLTPLQRIKAAAYGFERCTAHIRSFGVIYNRQQFEQWFALSASVGQIVPIDEIPRYTNAVANEIEDRDQLLVGAAQKVATGEAEQVLLRPLEMAGIAA